MADDLWEAKLPIHSNPLRRVRFESVYLLINLENPCLLDEVYIARYKGISCIYSVQHIFDKRE